MRSDRSEPVRNSTEQAACDTLQPTIETEHLGPRNMARQKEKTEGT
jgi:hypothetical protein